MFLSDLIGQYFLIYVDMKKNNISSVKKLFLEKIPIIIVR